MSRYVSDAVVRRLPSYYRHLRELEAAGVVQVSSKELGEQMHQTPSQIRQDINCFGGFGRQGYGYKVSELKEHIGEILGLNHPHTMIIIGAGSIGSAVARYPSFPREGFRILALFDVDPARIGGQVQDIPIHPMDDLEAFLSDNAVDIAVLAVPVDQAQETLLRLEACGIRAIWNFAPLDLQYATDRMIVQNVHLSDSLQVLTYRMAHPED